MRSASNICMEVAVADMDVCIACKEEICPHGNCGCVRFGDGFCPDCYREVQAELDAGREIKWQRDQMKGIEEGEK